MQIGKKKTGRREPKRGATLSPKTLHNKKSHRDEVN